MTFIRLTTKFLSYASNSTHRQLDVRDGESNPFSRLVVEALVYVSGHFIVASLVVELIHTYGSLRVWSENAGTLSLADCDGWNARPIERIHDGSCCSLCAIVLSSWINTSPIRCIQLRVGFTLFIAWESVGTIDERTSSQSVGSLLLLPLFLERP